MLIANSASGSKWISISEPEGQTDLANARRFVWLHADKARFVHAWGKWLIWDGTRWRIDDDGSAIRLAKDVADHVWADARKYGNDAALRFAARTAQERSIRSLLKLSESELSASPAEMDGNEWLLNCPNGTVDLRSGILRDHRREDLLTRRTTAEFTPDASSATWDSFLNSTFGGDAALVQFVQRFFGYALTGDIREHVLAVLHGGGANGKTTLIEAFLHAVGPDYASKCAPGLLMLRQADSHPTERADLFGKRFVATSETEDGRGLNETLVKDLTGGDTIKARRMREDFWEFKPTWKIALATNYLPRIAGTDEGIWRRVRIVPFNQTFRGADQDKGLPEKLRQDGNAILAWAVRGCLDWQLNGLGTPPAVIDATDRYRSESDTVGRFITDRCIIEPGASVRAKELYQAITGWAADEGQLVPTQRQFGRELRARGFERFTSDGTVYRGLRLADAATEGRKDTEPKSGIFSHAHA